MGDRNVVLVGSMYIGGTKLVGNVTETEIKYDDKEYTNDQVYLKIPSSQEATFTATFDATCLIRRLCPNNWLKLHGYPMRRRRKR